MMNNLRENNCSVFDSSDPDPRNWKKIAHIEDPLWVGKYPNPFHMVFSMDGSKLYLSILHPSPAASGVMVVDTKTWKIKKEIQGIGPGMQTLAVTYDGKYVVGVFSGFQRLSSGIAFIDTETDELVGIWPSNGGHHDCVIVPRTLEHMNQELAGFVVPFRDAVGPPPAAEEGPILVVTADGKGVPMRRPVQEGP